MYHKIMLLKRIVLFITSVTVVFLLSVYVVADESYSIIITCDTSFDAIVSQYRGDMFIRGESKEVKLFLPSQMELEYDLMIENLTLSGECTIYAAGYHLYIEDNVTSESRLNVYGGGNGIDVECTNVELYGGKYKSIYGGGYNSSITEDTNLVVGGNVNSGDDIDDTNIETWSPCYIYGGCYNGFVGGSTNVFFDGNAVARYIYGAGSGNADNVKDTNIILSGGKVMNVYGGAPEIVLTGCNTNITMLGGIAESIFGGSSLNNIVGNTQVVLLGGEVTRRVYSGCYNDWEYRWKSSYYVNGNTCLIIGPSVLLNTKKDLAIKNQVNIGVFSGSRIGEDHDDEINTVLYIEDSFSLQSSKIGEKSALSIVFHSYADFIADCSTGGYVLPGESSGEIFCVPFFGNYLTVNGNIHMKDIVSLSQTQTTNVDFMHDFAIEAVSVTEDNHINMTVTCNNVYNAEEPVIIVSVINPNNKTEMIFMHKPVHCTFDLDLELKKVYSQGMTVKVLIIDRNLSPLCEAYNGIWNAAEKKFS